MPTINPNLVPTISPGNIFSRFTEDDTLTIRWTLPTDPVFYEVINRPMADITLRQLILAKALDQINKNMGYLSLFPFIIQPLIQSGSSSINLPIRLFWDMHVSLPSKWASLRLARVDRIDGTNGSDSFTGTFRFIFTAQEVIGGSESATETALFYADYVIDSALEFQIINVLPATIATVTGFTVIDTGEQDTVAGSIIFRTGDQTDGEISGFYNFLPPGSDAQYPVVNTPGDSAGSDFDLNPINHGTGILVSSAYNAIPPADSDALTWIDTFNYPYDLDADLSSEGGSTLSVTLPRGLFREFNLTAPAGDMPTGDVSGLFYPVWVKRIVRDGDSGDLTFYFATFNVTDSDPDQSNPIEFASLTLSATMVGGQIVKIIPVVNLLLEDDSSFEQHFGRGHVVLSKKWDVSGGEVTDMFEDFPLVTGSSSEALFARASTRVSSYGLSRVPKYVPTIGQSRALRGTSDRFNTPILPGDDNRYVTEKDEGLGDAINLDEQTGISANDAIEAIGYMATSVHKLARLDIDLANAGSDPNFYENEVLPRLTILFGRAPVFGDEYYDGVKFLTFNGDSWIG